jgi:hypothetical protein
MTPNIASAMVRIAQAIPQIGKADRNQFARYNYVSIDKYYEAVAKIAAANGILWQPREVAHEIIPNVGKDGSVKTTYAFDLYHESGDLIEEFSKFTILHAIQGAQTAGSAASYADKLFMRTAFKVITGEEDADATNPEDLKIRAKSDTNVKEVMKTFPDAEITEVRAKPEKGATSTDPSPHMAVISHLNKDGQSIIKTDTKDWKSVKHVLQLGLNACDTVGLVRSLWSDNIGVIEKMEVDDKATHAEVRTIFNTRRDELKKK